MAARVLDSGALETRVVVNVLVRNVHHQAIVGVWFGHEQLQRGEHSMRERVRRVCREQEERRRGGGEEERRRRAMECARQAMPKPMR